MAPAQVLDAAKGVYVVYSFPVDFSRTERAELTDLFDELGPDAPTLCEGWRTHDLAAHLWIRETDPLAAPGLLAKPLAGLTERRLAETRSRWDYATLVNRIRTGPAKLSMFALPGVDEEANTAEYFVHHEDVRRANGHGPRQLPSDVEDWFWRRLRLLGRALFRRVDIGVVLERNDSAARGTSAEDTIRASVGNPIVTIVGHPSEITLYGFGRRDAADVRLIGEPDALETLARASFGL